VALGSATRVDIEIGRLRRIAHLRYGRVLFDIARATDPFMVETATATITASEGVIDIEQRAFRNRVQVLAGTANVRGLDTQGARILSLGPGQSATVNSGGAAKKDAAGPAPVSTRAMLRFDRTPLRDAVALANRYSDRQIILVGDFDALRLTGAFKTGDPAGLSEAVATVFGLSSEHGPDGNFIVSRDAPHAHQK
jgi:transmembrane sensor